MKRLLTGVSALLILASVAIPSGNSAAQTSPEESVAKESYRTTTDLLVEVGKRNPGFGGVYYDPENDVLNVFAVGKVDKESVAQAITEVFGASTVPAGGVRIIPGKFTIDQLTAWNRLALYNLHGKMGVNVTGVSEGRNRVLVGVEADRFIPQVEEALKHLAIPLEAVVLEVVGPITEGATLSDSRRPVDGGVKIYNSDKLGSCTLGFVTKKGGTELGIITNTHCTRTRGSIDSDKFHQPVESGTTNLVGTETIDPPYFTNSQNPNCPPNAKCRNSDSVFVKSSGGLTLDQGYIAKTLSSGQATGSTTIDANNRFRITYEGFIAVGDVVQKVGYKTGWTYGTVSETCATITNSAGFTYVCQGRASYGNNSGDSGSPVFKITSGNDVALVGMNWTGNGTTDGYFSKIGGIYLDLGSNLSWNSCAPEFGC